MKIRELHSCAGLSGYIDEIGFLPLLDSGIPGFSADEAVSDECRYTTFPEGGWEWPVWEWKGTMIQEYGFVYGKFFNKKAGFISKEWWPDFCNYRRSRNTYPEYGSIEETILSTLRDCESLITRELRRECGFTGAKMRSKFDAYITRLEMACRIVTEDFVYPRDRHNRPYGWGWSLLTLPETLYGKEFCRCSSTPQESFDKLYAHFQAILPDATEKQILRLIG